MTTSELIKLLQDADPEGNSHVRILGDGIPYYVVKQQGYWDGPYDYIDEDGNYVQTTEDYKVDIGTIDLYDYLERKFDRTARWEDVEKSIITRYTSEDSINVKQRERLLKRFRDEYDEYVNIQTCLYENSKTEMIKNAQNGWLWFQDKRVDDNEIPNWYVYYHWLIYDNNGKDQGSNMHMTQPVLESGLWEKRDNGVKKGYYQWVYIGDMKNIKGKVNKRNIIMDRLSQIFFTSLLFGSLIYLMYAIIFLFNEFIK